MTAPKKNNPKEDNAADKPRAVGNSGQTRVTSRTRKANKGSVAPSKVGSTGKTKDPAGKTRATTGKARAAEGTIGKRKTGLVTKRRTATTSRRKDEHAGATQSVSEERFTPAWLRYSLAVVVVIVFSTAFYFLCIQPYAYRWKPCYGQKGYGVCIPVGFTVHGIDISHYQGDIDWTALTADDGRPFPLSFVFMKATEGSDHVDDRFLDNFFRARDKGLIRGAYHFFNPQTDPVRQAESFIRTVNLEPGDLPPVLDVETTGRSSDSELQEAIRIWMDHVQRHYGVPPILYTSYKFRIKHLNTPALDAYPYWIAHYYVDSVRYQGPWMFWQYTDVGDVPGIRGSVDLDVFNGALEDLCALTLPDSTSLH